MRNCRNCTHYDIMAQECAIDRDGVTFFHTFSDAIDCVEKGVWHELFDRNGNPVDLAEVAS